MIKNISEYNSIKDEIICEICQNILLRPKQCESCESFFCENCINSWLKKNNSCPKRCQRFAIKECPRLLKKLLEKLVILCPICKKEFNYDYFCYKHYEDCYNENKSIKCPFCPDCQIKLKLFEEYQKKYDEEKNQLLKEIQKYKDKIKELEGNKGFTLKWSRNQKKHNFRLSNEDKTITIDHSPCYAIYVLNQDFIGQNTYSFGLKVNTFGKLYDYLAIGFINEYFNNECFCCQPSNSFYIRIDVETIYSNNDEFLTKLDNKTNFSLRFILNLNNKSLEIQNYENNISYGKIGINGNNFKFFVSKCLDGTIEYSLLP
jgi:hypothetical protein